MPEKQTRKSRAQMREEKRQQRVRFWMGIFVIGIMVLSVLSFALVFYGMPASGGGLQFRVDDNQLFVQTRAGEVNFFSWPDAHQPMPPGAMQLINQADAIIILFDPTDEDNLPLIDFVRWDFSQYFDAPVGGALTNTSDIYPYDIGSCAMATQQTPVIHFTQGNEGISVENACITISAEQEGILFERDRILYSYFNII